MRHTGPPWMAFLWFGIELALVVAVCTGIDSRRQKAPATEAPAAMKVFPEWFSIAVAPPGTSGGGRILRRDSPEATKRLLEKIPSKELGHIVFDPLDHMTVGKKERIDAAITLGDVVDAVARFSGKGKPMVEGLRVASRMCVKLIGTDFIIDSRNTECQSIETSVRPFEPTLWAWDVTPKKPGRLSLTIQGTRILPVPKDGDLPRDLPAFERTILVNADRWYSFSRWMADNKAWFSPVMISSGISIGVPFVGWLYKKLRRRPRRQRTIKRRSYRR